MDKWLYILGVVQLATVVLAALLTVPVFLLTSKVNTVNKERVASAMERAADAEKAAAEANASIADANKAIAEADARAAEANRQAELARLEVAKSRQPRAVPSEYKQEFVERLAQHKGQPFELAGAGLDPEAMSLMTELVGVLTDAGWQHVDSQLGGMSASISGKTIGSPVAANDVGVAVMIWQTSPDETPEGSSSRFDEVGPAYADLINLLNAVGISTTTSGALQMPVKHRNTIRIEVGRKPQASSSWEKPLTLIPAIDD